MDGTHMFHFWALKKLGFLRSNGPVFQAKPYAQVPLFVDEEARIKDVSSGRPCCSSHSPLPLLPPPSPALDLHPVSPTEYPLYLSPELELELHH